jgi:hypothetical protein
VDELESDAARFELCEDDLDILGEFEQALRRAVRTGKLQPLQLVAVGNALHFLSELPSITAIDHLRVAFHLEGPVAGGRQISRYWALSLGGDEIYVDTGGYLHDEAIGGDSFSCFTFWIGPIGPSSIADYTHFSDPVVGGLQPYRDEMASLNLDDAFMSFHVE